MYFSYFATLQNNLLKAKKSVCNSSKIACYSLIQGISHWSVTSKSALRGRRIHNFIELWCLVGSRGLDIWVSSTSFQKNNIGWPLQPLTVRVSAISENWIFDDTIFHKIIIIIFCYCPKHCFRLIEGQQSTVEDYPNQDKLRKISVRRSDSNPGLPDGRPRCEPDNHADFVFEILKILFFTNHQTWVKF